MGNKKFVLSFFLALTVLTAVSFAFADTWTESSTPDIKEMEIYVNNAFVWYGVCEYNSVTLVWDCAADQITTPAFERGEEVEVRTVFVAGNESNDVRVKAEITGYDEDIEARTSFFDVIADNSYTRNLVLDIPSNIDEDSYTLHVTISGKSDFSGIGEAEIDMNVQRVTDLLEIMSVDTYGNFEAGNTLYADVVVKNRGSDKAEDIYVSASIAELGLARTIYLGDLDEVDDDHEDTEKVTIALALPSTAASGSYKLDVKAYNSKTSAEDVVSFAIAGTTSGEGKIVITPQTTMVNVEQGKGAVYTISIANFGSTSENVELSTEGTEGWATTQITPQAFNLASGKTETVSLYLVANEDAIAAEHIFTLKVEYDNAVEYVTLNANIAGAGNAAAPSLRTIMTVISVVLAVVIIVLLIILLTKKETKEVAETYY